jgi:hypothetical protein
MQGHMQAPFALLSLNLCIAVCCSLVQEAARGPLSQESEWFMERFMSDPQKSMRALHAVRSYLKSVEMIDRGLLWARIAHGTQSPAELKDLSQARQPGIKERDPAAVAEEPFFFEHKGKCYTPASQAPPPGGNQEFFEEAMRYQVALAAVEALHAAEQAASALSISCQAAKDVLAAVSLDHALQQDVDRDPDVLQAACITLAAG